MFEQCGNNLPFLENVDERIERFQFAALKLSEGKLSELDRAIALAKADWRDLLMAAGFGEVDIVRYAGNDGLPMFRPPRRRKSGGKMSNPIQDGLNKRAKATREGLERVIACARAERQKHEDTERIEELVKNRPSVKKLWERAVMTHPPTGPIPTDNRRLRQLTMADDENNSRGLLHFVVGLSILGGLATYLLLYEPNGLLGVGLLVFATLFQMFWSTLLARIAPGFKVDILFFFLTITVGVVAIWLLFENLPVVIWVTAAWLVLFVI